MSGAYPERLDGLVGNTLDHVGDCCRVMELDDTQPLESQIFRDHISRQATESLRNYNAEFTEDTRNTYETGQTGYVNLIQDIDAAQANSLSSPQNSRGSLLRNLDGPDDDNESEDELSSDPPILQKTSPPMEQALTTPSMSSQKRPCDGELVSSAYKTPVPDYKAFFSARKSKAPLGLSQLFGQTQADTSQLPHDELRSDAVFERPSPDFDPLEKTPGTATLSSPIQRSAASGRTFPDPRSSYRSMEESQKAREAILWKLQKEKEELKVASDNDDLDEDSGRRKTERDRRRAQIDQESRVAFEKVRIDGIPVGSIKKRKVGRPKTAMGASNQTPGAVREAMAISSDEDENEGDASSEESLDEYEEYSSSVLKKHRKRNENDFEPTSTSRIIKHDLINARPNSSPLPGRGQHTMSSSALKSKKRSSSSVFTRLPKVSSIRDRPTSETAVVLNSQEDLQRPKPLVEPSSPIHSSSHDHISQSQVATLASDFQSYPAKSQLDELDTSSAPQAPRYSVNLLGPRQGDREDTGVSSHIPSSPPVMQSLTQREKGTPAGHHEHGSQFDGANDSKEQPKSVSNDCAKTTRPNLRSHQQVERTDFDSAFAQKTPEKVNQSSVVSRSIHDRLDNGEVNGDAFTTDNHAAPSRTNPAPQERAGSQSNSIGEYATAQSRQTQSASINNTSQESAIRTPTKLQPMSFAAIHKSAPSPRTPLQTLGDVDVENDEDREYNNAVDPGIRDYTEPIRPAKKVKLKHMSYKAAAKSWDPTNQVGSDGKMIQDSLNTDSLGACVRNNVLDKTSGSLPGANEHKTPTANGKPSIWLPTVTPFKRAIAETPQTAHKDFIGTSPREVPAHTHHSPLTTTSTTGANGTVSQTRRRSLRSAPSISADADDSAPPGDVVAPDRILAKFRGSYMAYYPATLLGLSKSSPSKCSVRFDDTTTTDLERTLLVSLDLKVGDLLKVDQKGLKKTTYQICGRKNRGSESIQEKPAPTDIYGYDTLILRPKQRQSLPNGSNKQGDTMLEVPVWKIYITETIWIHYARRPSPHLDSLIAQCKSSENAAVDQSSSSAVSWTSPESGLFANITLAMTFLDSEEPSKADVSRMIRENGGHVITDKFDSLFDTSVPSTPQEDHSADLLTLQPTSSAASLGFVALITNSQSRRIKYVQALALNIPCLHSQWIYNCVKQQTLLPWSQYLLPAGQSSILNGAIHSRVLSGLNTSLSSPNTTTFPAMVEHRPRLLENANVLMIMDASKHDEKRKAFTFLAHAMGTKKIRWVKGATAAREKLTGNHDWNWVLVDEVKVREMSKQLLNDKTHETQRSKRNSTGRLVSAGSSAPAVTRSFKIIGDDHLVQCLISGASLEQSVALTV